MSERKNKAIVRRRTEGRTVSEIFSDTSINMTLDSAFEYFIAYKKTEGVRERTEEDYNKFYTYFSDWLKEHYPEVTTPSDCTTAILREHIIYLREEKRNERTNSIGLSPYTINLRIRFLKVFFNVLQTEQIINTNPAINIKQMRVDEDTFKPLTDSEIDRLLKLPKIEEYAQFRDLVAMMIILDCGIRSKELFSLEIKDVDIKQRAIFLPGPKAKSRKPRLLPLSNQVIKLVFELITEVRTNFDTPYLFVSNFGEKYHDHSFRRRLYIYKEKAKIDKRVTPHMLRHQFCRNYILNGGDIFTLQKIAGHEDISTTRKYVQMTDDDIQKQHNLYSPIVRLRKNLRN